MLEHSGTHTTAWSYLLHWAKTGWYWKFLYHGYCQKL